MRIEKDSMGEVSIPDDALWGAQSERARQNFPISGISLPKSFIKALVLIKRSAAIANNKLGLLTADKMEAIVNATTEILNGEYYQHFPLDIFQTGSGTSSNMNANEVIANLAKAQGAKIHPNDDVNMSQSSNDVIPSSINLSASIDITTQLLPNLRHLIQTIEKRAVELKAYTKTGRTHLMDAMPVTFGQELSGYASQLENAYKRITASLGKLQQLALGGTAVGTGINAHKDFASLAAKELSAYTKISFQPHDNYFEALSSQNTSLEISSQLKILACSLMQIANDFRLMNSGPLSGISDISLPAVQPGSSIMPGKVNPVIPESVCMVAAAVIGNDAAITIATQAGNFQLNVMLPLIAHRLLDSIHILANACKVFADKAIFGFTVNQTKINDSLAKNPILVTALNSVIGYEEGAAIAKQAYQEQRSVIDVALEKTKLTEAELKSLLDPFKLTKGGV